MDQKQMAITARRITEARAALVRDNPFFGHLALGLQLACAPCGTACTDGERLIFDPGFAEQLRTEEEIAFVVLHEVLHCALEHCTRSRNRDPELYNRACDVVVNSTILEMWGMATFHVAGQEVMHLAPDGREGRVYNAEEIYQMLLTGTGRQKGQSRVPGMPFPGMPSGGPARKGDGTQALDRHDIWQGIQQPERIRDMWNQKVVKAAGACQGVQMSLFMRKLTDALIRRSEPDWKQLLHDFIQHDTYDYSFLPPDRRFTDRDFFLPAFNINEDHGSVRDIWVCVDASGSVSDGQLREAMMEVQDAMHQTGLTGSISFFDTQITEPEPFETEEEFRKIIPKGGGTSFHVIFEYLRDHLSAELPRAILVFTDGHVWNWPKEEDALGVPVLWLICRDGNTKAPWGQVAKL